MIEKYETKEIQEKNCRRRSIRLFDVDRSPLEKYSL